jgi:hypothetical protein
MYVDFTSLTADNVMTCAPLWGGAETYAPGELPQVLDAAALLLRERRGQGAIIREDGHPRAFGMTTFVDERFIDAYLENPHPHIGKRLLLDARNASTSVLRLDQIAERNGGDGLQLVVTNSNIDPATRDPSTVMGAVIAATFDCHRGYRIARYVNEVFGEMAVSMVAASRSFEIRRIFELLIGGGTMRSLVGTVTREQAAASTNPLLALFAYSPPRLGFTPAEQELLTEALDGVTDEGLSDRLRIPVSSVKARWTRVQQRVAYATPELFGDVAEGRSGTRGPQTRHLILRYVRDHPSELTPYASPRRQRRRRSAL